MTRTKLLAIPTLLVCIFTVACAAASSSSSPPTVDPSASDPSPAAGPVLAPSPSSTTTVAAAEVPTGSTGLRHPGAPRTRSSGEIVGPEAPEVPATGVMGSPCAERKPGESWDSNGSTCMCEPSGEVRCSRWTSRRGKVD